MAFLPRFSQLFKSAHPVMGWDAQRQGLGLGHGISIHPPRRRRDVCRKWSHHHTAHFNPSTLVLGWDAFLAGYCPEISDFNPPTPMGVGPNVTTDTGLSVEFQSAHSVGSGTVTNCKQCRICSNFNPPAPRRAGPGNRASVLHRSRDFNPPTPWGWDVHVLAEAVGILISIHPPRGGVGPHS